MSETTQPNRRRRGSVYLMALGLGTILAVIALAAIAVGRIDARTQTDSRNWLGARNLAFSAAEHAQTQIDRTSNWRLALNGVTVEKSLGGGTFQWNLIDETDGDLADNASDAVTIVAAGTVDNANYSLKLKVVIEGGLPEPTHTPVTPISPSRLLPASPF